MESMKPRPPSRGRGGKHKPRSRPTSRTAWRPEELKAAIERGRRLEGRVKETARELRTQAAGEGEDVANAQNSRFAQARQRVADWREDVAALAQHLNEQLKRCRDLRENPPLAA